MLVEIDALLERHTNAEVIAILGERGRRTGRGRAFDEYALTWVMYNHGLMSQKQRLRKAGFLTRKEMANELGRSYWKIKDMQSRGLLRSRTVNGRGDWLFNPISEQSETIRQIAAEHGNLAPNKKAPAASTVRGAV